MAGFFCGNLGGSLLAIYTGLTKRGDGEKVHLFAIAVMTFYGVELLADIRLWPRQ